MSNDIKLWVAINIEEDGRCYAYATPFTSADNALCKLDIKGIKSANIYTSKKKAMEIAKFWNDCYKSNGTYMFNNPRF